MTRERHHSTPSQHRGRRQLDLTKQRALETGRSTKQSMRSLEIIWHVRDSAKCTRRKTFIEMSIEGIFLYREIQWNRKMKNQCIA